MVVNEFWVILPGVKKWKVGNKTKEKYMLVRRQNLAETERGSYYKEEWLKEFLKVIIMITVILKIINSSSYRREDFANSCYKIVSTIFLQKLINDFAVSRHYCGTGLLVEDVSHGFWNENYIF